MVVKVKKDGMRSMVIREVFLMNLTRERRASVDYKIVCLIITLVFTAYGPGASNDMKMHI